MLNLKEIELIYNAIPTACLILQANAPIFTIAAGNPAFFKATYSSPEHVIGRPFFQAFPANPDDDGSRTLNIMQALDQVLGCKKPHHVDRHRYDLPLLADDDQHVHYWSIETYPLLDEHGQVQYIVQSSTDVTALVKAEQQLEANNARLLKELQERERIEAKLQLSNERYKYVNMATNDAIYDWNISTDNIEWSQAFLNLYGYSTDAQFPIGKWMELLHPEDNTRLIRSFYAALNDQSMHSWTGEYRLRRMDCNYADVEANGYILRDEQGLAQRMIGVLRDVSARKLAEAELESLKDTFSDLFHLNPIPMWVFDYQSLRFLDVNDAAITHYGYTRDEFLSMSVTEIRPIEDTDEFLKIIENEVRPGAAHFTTARHQKKSGEIILVNVKGKSIRYGSKPARIAVAIDVTEKAKFEKALMESERRFKTLIQESSDFIAIVDAEGTYKYVSPPVERLFGMKSEQLIGKNALDAIHECDRHTLSSQLQNLSDKNCIKLAPYRIVDQYGKTQWMETIITDLRNDSGIDGIVCNARVVTDRVEQELKIKEHLERFNAVSKATSDVIWDFNLITGDILWNHGLQTIFGYQELKVNFQWWYDRVHPEDVERVTGVINHHVEHKLPRWTSEYRFRCANGNYKYVLDRGFLIFDDREGHVLRMIGALQDISERVAYTKTIEAQNRRLREIAWSQAHLVRGPLTSILGLMQLLKDAGTDETTRESIIAYLDRSASQLDETIKSIISKSHDS